MATDVLSSTFQAIADPTRRALLARLRVGEATVTELAAPFAMTMPAITKHLKVLERAGLIERRRDAQRRPCRLRPERLAEATAWLEMYRELWEARLDRLEAYLAQPEGDAPVTPAPETAGSDGSVDEMPGRDRPIGPDANDVNGGGARRRPRSDRGNNDDNAGRKRHPRRGS